MERFSKWRDAGTGIQPFLAPQPSHADATIVDHLITGLAYVWGAARGLNLMLLTLLHWLLVDLLGGVLQYAPIVGPLLVRAVATLTTRLALWHMGYWWIASPEVVSLRRGKGLVTAKPVDINPARGDMIVANWTSYVELLWMAYRYNPTFLLPVHAPPLPSAPSTAATGRQTGTGSAALSLPAVSNAPRSPLLGYRRASLLQLITRTGLPPPYASEGGAELVTLDEARRSARGPICVFPEGTTSNGRGLLRFAEGFGGGLEVPARGYKVWLVYFKHPPPSPHQPSATLAAPSSPLLPNPLSHLFSALLPTLLPRTLQIRILHPDSSLSSGDFLASSVLGLDSARPSTPQDPAAAVQRDIPVFSECVATLMVSLGRTKRLGLGWEDKVGFIEYAEERRAGVVRKAPATGSRGATARTKKAQ